MYTYTDILKVCNNILIHTCRLYHDFSTPPQGKIIYANGDLFEGSFSSGQIEGEGSLHCQNGLEYKGNWKHSQVRTVEPL